MQDAERKSKTQILKSKTQLARHRMGRDNTASCG